jgi:hypothetical protein
LGFAPAFGRADAPFGAVFSGTPEGVPFRWLAVSSGWRFVLGSFRLQEKRNVLQFSMLADRLFASGCAWGGVGVFRGGGVEIAFVVLGGVGVDGCVAGACGCGIVSEWAGGCDGGVII